MKTMSQGDGAGTCSTAWARTSARSPAPSSVDIALEDVERRAVLLDEGAVRGAARQRFEAERAGAGEEIGDLEALEAADPAGEHREQALAGAVAGRAGGLPGGASIGRPRHAPAMILTLPPRDGEGDRAERGGGALARRHGPPLHHASHGPPPRRRGGY